MSLNDAERAELEAYRKLISEAKMNVGTFGVFLEWKKLHEMMRSLYESMGEEALDQAGLEAPYLLDLIRELKSAEETIIKAWYAFESAVVASKDATEKLLVEHNRFVLMKQENRGK
jgi:hypothetical protein